MGRCGYTYSPPVQRLDIGVFPGNERVASLHLQVGEWALTVVCVYAPFKISILLRVHRGVLEDAPFGYSVILVVIFTAQVGSDSETCSGVIGRNNLPDLNLSIFFVFLLFYFSA